MSLGETKDPSEYCDRDAVSGVVLPADGWTDGRLFEREWGARFRGQTSGREWGGSQVMLLYFGNETLRKNLICPTWLSQSHETWH